MNVNKKLFFILFFVTYFSTFGSIFAQNQTSVINHINTNKKVLALTFDADMNPKMRHMLLRGKVTTWYNQDVIDILEKNKVPATLFLTGMWIETYPDITRQLSQNPLFEIGNHSYSHPAFSSPCYGLKTINESQDLYQISKTEELLSKNTEKHSLLFRFPGLCYDSEDLDVVSSAKYKSIGGDVLGRDGFQKDTNLIVSNVVDHVRPGSIVVLHMMGGPNAPHTADTLQIIIDDLKREGYTFVTVSDLLKQ